MDVFTRACAVLAICISLIQITFPYYLRNHPCCLEPNENVTLAMIIDAFEIYGHDPTDKLDNLWLYQNEMMRIKTAEDQFLINERVHIATDHLGRFIKLHIQELKVLLITLDDVIDNMLTMYENHNSIAAERKATYTGGPVPMEFYLSQATDHLGRFIKLHIQELKVLLITLDDVIDNMLTMYENHNSIAAERKATYTGGPVPMEFYLSQEFYCGKNVYMFVSELYSDIYNMGKGIAPYCKDRSFVFLGFLHFHDDQKYYLVDDPSISFPTDNYLHGLECHVGICIFRFPFKKLLQRDRDIATLPKAIVKCGVIMYKLPPLTAASCIITSGSFIFDFNIQGLRYRHHDYLLTMPNGQAYYTKEPYTPLVCDHHVCEWNYTNHYGGPFLIPGDPGSATNVVVPFVEPTLKPDGNENDDNITVPYILEGCLFMYPPNYGSIAGKSYLDTVELHDDRFTCNAAGGAKGLYWYPQWMGAMPHHPYPALGDDKAFDPHTGPYFPHQYNKDVDDEDTV